MCSDFFNVQTITFQSIQRATHKLHKSLSAITRFFCSPRCRTFQSCFAFFKWLSILFSFNKVCCLPFLCFSPSFTSYKINDFITRWLLPRLLTTMRRIVPNIDQSNAPTNFIDVRHKFDDFIILCIRVCVCVCLDFVCNLKRRTLCERLDVKFCLLKNIWGTLRHPDDWGTFADEHYFKINAVEHEVLHLSMTSTYSTQ